jgi:mono/diheme cytochrome c family protein
MHRLSSIALALLLPAVAWWLFGAAPAQTDPKAGERLFKANCVACHAVNKKVVGPALRGYKDRIPGGDWIYRFIRNSDQMKKDRDPYAVKINKEYNGQAMTGQRYLTDAQIDLILAYIDTYPATAP